jgi:hypothetical protein
MSISTYPGSARRSADRPTRSTTLRGKAVPVAWTVLWSMVALTIVVYVVAIPARFRELQAPDATTIQVLAQLGVPLGVHVWGEIILEVGIALAYTTVASIIFWQRSRDWLAMFVSLALTMYVAYATPTVDALMAGDTFWSHPARFVQAMGISLALIFFYIFPDGRFVPRVTGGLALLCMASAIGPAFIDPPDFNPFDPFTLSHFWFVVLVGWFVTCLLAQGYRFLFYSDAVQRQQTKMVVFTTGIAILVWIGVDTPKHVLELLGRPTEAIAMYRWLTIRLFLLTIIPIPFAFAFSILRYRLWDIDALINRTIVYASLTAILAGLYTASIGLSQRLFVAFTGSTSDGAIVFTTLVVASAFTPVKSALQKVVDKYFKQARHPETMLAAFRQRVQSVVQVIDTRALLQSTLDEAVHAFGAVSGAVYREINGERTIVLASEGWSDRGQMTVPLESTDFRFGVLSLGPRTNGQSYTRADREALQAVLASVARAIAQSEPQRSGAAATAGIVMNDERNR